MKRLIEIDDIVMVIWKSGIIQRGRVEHSPADSGDMWYIREGKTLHAINPSCSDLIEITLIATRGRG